ncbi:subclass B3 metallo-beta-lactamase [Terriglobus tenax]|uniref:subclass B3 metallo-beta-lactamase n=1 Tax=Terriglobus tenax TaxID=1111115 RepID=UPI0021E01A95|nr:subclass B3 metallo-beta-lactamase [Terriglobus tenax]
MIRRCALLAVLFSAAFTAHAKVYPNFPPHKVAGNLYSVGDSFEDAYLVVTPKGNILINVGDSDEINMVKQNIAALGFKYADTKILLSSQAHFDHVGAAEQVRKETGATFEVMDGDVELAESGGKIGVAYTEQQYWFPPAHVDKTLHDGDVVELGGVKVVAHKTAGHTKGTTTFTMTVTDAGKSYHVVIVGAGGIGYGDAGYELKGNKKYPQIVEDQRHAYAVLKSLPCDIFLGAHGKYYGLEEKYPRMKVEGVKAWVDPAGYKKYVAEKSAELEAEVKKEQAAK